MLIRPLTTLDECRRVTELEKRIWHYPDGDDAVPAAVLIVAVKRGGILLGGFDAADEMQGFVYSTPGLKGGRLLQWSHMLGVLPGARDAGLGRHLKLAQRDAVIAMGLDLIEWTFDPLQALNAHFNFAKLGVVVTEYEENVYGQSVSPLHGAAPTDRFVAEWRVATPHVERRIAARQIPPIRDSRVMAAPVINPATDSHGSLIPGPADLTVSSPRVLVEIPTTFEAMLGLDPELALQWRLTTRQIFQSYFARGYRVVDFLLSRDAGRGQYLLAVAPDAI